MSGTFCAKHPKGRSGKRFLTPFSSRRGSVYIVVLCTALIVSVLGVSALMVQRIQRSGFQGTEDANQARLNARTALRMGMLRLENDPDWRYNFSNGAWEADVAIRGNTSGTYTLEGIDPSDNDLSDTPEDPLVLIGTGTKGAVVQKVQITLAPENRGLSCLEVAMHAEKKVDFNNATVVCDQTISSNDMVIAIAAFVRSDVEAVNTINGSTYRGSTTTGIDPRELPDPATVFDYYKSNGTWIHLSNLPIGFSNLLKNSGIENGTTNWAPSTGTEPGADCQIAQDTSEAHNGTASLKVTDREAFNAGPIQYLTDFVQNGVSYDIQVWVKMAYEDAEVRIVVNTNGTNSGDSRFASAEMTVKKEDGWTKVTGSLTPTWSGTLNSSYLKIETKSGEEDFYIDDVVFKESGNDRTIYRQVLSPTANPFGTGINPQGIYVIDCDDKTIVIKNSRIVGTLVLLQPKKDSSIGGGPLSWEPAVPNFPALLVDQTNMATTDITIEPSDAGLVELANNINFNPPGTPYTGIGEDNDQNETYPSRIKGLIYSSHKIKFKNHPVIQGIVVGNGDIKIDDQFDLVHDPIYPRNPPPGFSGPEQIKILLDSATKVVD